jgi:hexulose-6-phosphate isomerase
MTFLLNRREFAGAAAAAGLAMTAAAKIGRAESFKHPLHKAVMANPKTDPHAADTLKKIKDAGFEGIESLDWNVSPDDAKKCRELVEKAGLRVHSVLLGWLDFNSPNEKDVANSISKAEVALRAAQGYGADDVLLVPCKLGGVPMPNPWEFDIKFDEKTCHLKQLTKNDDAKFKAYIDAQNLATDTSRVALRKLIPVAEATGVIVGHENVWNNLWVRPDFFKAFVVSCDSPWIRAYYDVANHVKYLIPCEDWVRTLGKLIIKLHIKDYKLTPDGHNGSWPSLHEGSVNWPNVRRALDEIGYEGWGTIEAPGPISLTEQNKRFDAIIAGE